MFKSEAEFEKAVIKKLTEHGWSTKVLRYPTEKDLLDNWANILYQNNKGIDRLNNQPLTESEKQQLIEQIKALKTPAALNKFINGKSIAIKRDNPKDPIHLGKEVSLFIYDREQIAGGKSVYQIVQQPVFPSQNVIKTSSRGDLMLLINGMPVIHIELKRSGIPVSQATEQIKRYAAKGVFTGLFSLVQVFVAMNPEDCRYFANPGEGPFNDKFFFKWADRNNEPYTSWDKIIVHLLSIPMAHKLIGFYTVPDDGDGVLKVLRSYQYYAVEAIANRVDNAQWTEKDRLGGYVWHTTGSGKTMTSFKAAQLLANSRKCDKVVFLIDRIELGTQSAKEYRNFADEREEIQETESSHELIEKLKSNDLSNTLIVTSIQKMSKLKSDNGFKTYDIEAVANKKIVFIIDECHRSTFGEMLVDIKATFPRALYFGFTGTPILEENQKKSNTQTDLFGNELHRYSIADGIRDGNVLPFDPRQVRTFKDSDLKRVVALQEAKASTIKEAVSDRRKQVIYNHFINKVDMAGHYDLSGDYIKGIEDFINTAQYERDDTKKIETQHQYYVVLNILENWELTSVANKYHAIFATSSIKEAIQYYRLFKEMMGKNGLPTLKITCLFDQSIDNDGGATDKEEALVEILTDYNVLYKKTYTIPTYYYFKKDVSARLAHKDKYLRFENMDEDHLDLLIVVDQMLTGYDSKWVNTLYLDKKLRNEAIVQAFSRTNRINDSDKPYGIIKYYRYPHTMEKNIDKAFELYSGNRPYGIFVDKLPRNMKKVSELYQQIKALFVNAGIPDFVKLPEDQAARGKFASLFSQLNKILISSKLQGFQWGKTDVEYNLEINEKIYYILAQRYKELFIIVPGVPIEGAAFDIDATCLEINTDKIDAAYLNSQFDKYVIEIQENRKDGPLAENIYGEIHRSFAMLNQEEQRFAEEIIFDLQNGNLFVKKGKTFRDYLNDYQERNKNDQIHRFATLVGYDEALLRELVDKRLNLSNIDAYGQFDPLRESLNVDVAKKYFEDKYEKKVSVARARRDAENLVRDFILQGGFDI
jgi:type I restriction enzyme R subunit